MAAIQGFALWIANPLGITHLTTPGGALYGCSVIARAIAFGWAGSEAVVFYAKARKRARIGLGDAVVANRFLLWAIWSGAAFALLVCRSITPFIVDQSAPNPITPTWLVALQMTAGLGCGVAIWLTFAPPRSYRAWIGRAATST